MISSRSTPWMIAWRTRMSCKSGWLKRIASWLFMPLAVAATTCTPWSFRWRSTGGETVRATSAWPDSSAPERMASSAARV